MTHFGNDYFSRMNFYLEMANEEIGRCGNSRDYEATDLERILYSIDSTLKSIAVALIANHAKDGYP